MRRREFFQRFGAGSVLKEMERLELACDLLQVHYAEALLRERAEEFLEDLRQQLEKAETVTVRNEGLLRGETLRLFRDLFSQYEARGKRFERKRS